MLSRFVCRTFISMLQNEFPSIHPLPDPLILMRVAGRAGAHPSCLRAVSAFRPELGTTQEYCSHLHMSKYTTSPHSVFAGIMVTENSLQLTREYFLGTFEEDGAWDFFFFKIFYLRWPTTLQKCSLPPPTGLELNSSHPWWHFRTRLFTLSVHCLGRGLLSDTCVVNSYWLSSSLNSITGSAERMSPRACDHLSASGQELLWASLHSASAEPARKRTRSCGGSGRWGGAQSRTQEAEERCTRPIVLCKGT